MSKLQFFQYFYVYSIDYFLYLTFNSRSLLNLGVHVLRLQVANWINGLTQLPSICYVEYDTYIFSKCGYSGTILGKIHNNYCKEFRCQTGRQTACVFFQSWMWADNELLIQVFALSWQIFYRSVLNSAEQTSDSTKLYVCFHDEVKLIPRTYKQRYIDLFLSK